MSQTSRRTKALGTLPVAALVTLSLSGTSAQAAIDPKANAKARVLAVCRTTWDEPGPWRSEQLFETIVALAEQGRKALLGLASSKKSEARCALQYLIKLEDKRVIPIARKILDDPRAAVGLKEEALTAVAVFKDTASFERVLRIFQSRAEGLVAPAAAALGALGDERGLRLLREALADPTIGGAVVSAVGVKGHEEAVDPLLAFLHANPVYEKYESLRSDVLMSLARIGTTRSRAAAVELVASYKDDWFRNSVTVDIKKLLLQQRQKAQDASEVAEIDALLVQLDRPQAPASQK